MDKKQRVEELKNELKEGIAKLEAVNIDELSEEDLEQVAGGAEDCSTWCCSDTSGGDDKEIEPGHVGR